MSLITDKEISVLFQKDYSVINKKAKTHPHEYEIIKLGSICKKYDIDENSLEKVIKILEIIKEK